MSDFPDFDALRKDPRHHLGMGDIRLTIAQQDAVMSRIEELDGLCNFHINEAKKQDDLLLKRIKELLQALKAERERNTELFDTDTKVIEELQQRIKELEALRDRLTGEIEGEMKLLGRIAELEAEVKGLKEGWVLLGEQFRENNDE